MPVTVLDQRLGFSTLEACAAAGLTYRVVDYWVRCGAVSPSVAAHGQGSRRSWSIDDVDRLTRIGAVVHRAERLGLDVECGAVTAMWDAMVAGGTWSVTLSA